MIPTQRKRKLLTEVVIILVLLIGANIALVPNSNIWTHFRNREDQGWIIRASSMALVKTTAQRGSYLLANRVQYGMNSAFQALIRGAM